MKLYVGFVIVALWLLSTISAAALVPERSETKPIAYTRAADDLQRDFPTVDTSPGQAAHWLRTVQLNTLSTQPRARSGPTTTTRAVVRRVYAAPSGSCAEWVAAAGIGDTASAFELIARESGCSPTIKNRRSGACGVAQELPCGKSGCALGDGACQVRWMDSYVLDRYGSWANALAFQKANNWY